MPMAGDIHKDRDPQNNKRALNPSGTKPSISKRKITKTTYFFKPQNTLTGAPTDAKSLINTHVSDVTHPKSDPDDAASIKEHEYELFVAQNQSSDESFEGIKWKISPSGVKVKSKVNTTPSSSPLKNILGASNLSGIQTDQAELILQKYGSGFLNMASHTPKVTKSVSDLSFETLETKPSLQRTKSLGEPGSFKTPNVLFLPNKSILSTENSKLESSRLKSWISKFDFNASDTFETSTNPQDNSTSKEEKLNDLFLRSSPTKEFPLKPVSESQLPADSSDPFSDEEEFLATYAAKSNSMPAMTKQEDSFLFEPKTPQEVESTEYTNKIEQLSKIQSDVESNPVLSYTRPNLRRFQIVNILSNQFKLEERTSTQLILTVKDSKSQISKIILRGEYTSLNLQEGDLINLVITHPKTPTLVDDSTNILIWHPDVLVSATTVSQQLSCERKPVLKDRLSFPSEASIPLLSGTILHEIFQACFQAEDWSRSFMEEIMHAQIEANLMLIFLIQCERDDLIKEIELSLPYLQEWFQKYYKSESGVSTITNKTIKFAVNKALDIEENIWSPLFGIKGKVDVSLEAQVKRPESKGTYLIPMEIKTGRPYLSHHAQSSLYALLFKDRYDMDVNSFLLVYTKEKLSQLGDIRPADLRSLINLRNRIAEFLCDGVTKLPSVIRKSMCDRCEVQTECMTLHHLTENGTAESSGINKEVYTEITEHLDKQVHKDFYKYWDLLITKEEEFLKRMKKDLWVQTAKEREEKNGKALASMVIIDESQGNSSTFKYSYTFVRSQEHSTTKGTLQHSQLTKYDRVIVSDEEGHFTLSGGFISSVLPDRIVITADRRIINSPVKLSNFNLTNNQRLEGVLHSSPSKYSQVTGKSKLFRIDKDEMFHGMGLARYNILNLLLANGDAQRRKQIVELEPPRFVTRSATPDTLFNVDQMKAFNQVLSTEDYSLILGMPGTGKTTLIAGIIDHLVKQGKSILLASYTHSAVDNILVKVKQYGIDILRIGHPSRVHRDIKEFCPLNIKTYEEYLKVFLKPQVVGVTCLGINDVCFNLRDRFDYCIIDEASQVSLPISLGPLRYCEKFILVGDHNQLPPLVTHQNATVKQGLSYSLFQFLNDKFPQSVTELTYQYRMCSDIMKLSNELIYNNLLKCGSTDVANQKLEIPNPLGYKDMVTGDKDFWMKWVLREENKVIFLDHDLVPSYEKCQGEKVENFTEAVMVWQIVQALTKCGVDESKIGIMSLYRAQLRLINKFMLQHENIEVMTADQFQGRDKDCIIISLVRSNKENRVGDLLQEWRRVNVAITRAKSKLIILGSKSTLSLGGGIMKRFLDLVHKEKWIYKLPPDASSHYAKIDLDSIHDRKRSQKHSPSNSRITSQARAIQNSPLIRNIVNEI